MRAHVHGDALDVQGERMGAPERKQVVDHHGEAGHLVLDRLQLGGARTRTLALPQHGRVGADDGEGIAQVVADLRDVEPAIAIEIAQAVREMLERPGNATDLAAPGNERDVAFAVAEPAARQSTMVSSCLRCRLPARSNSRTPTSTSTSPIGASPSASISRRSRSRYCGLRVTASTRSVPARCSATVPRSDARPSRAAAISSASPPARAPSIQARRVPGRMGSRPAATQAAPR